MKNHYSLRVAFSAFIGLLSFSTLFAGTIPVTTAADSGAGSLRDAVAAAMTGDTVTFDASLDGTTITLDSQIDLSDDITIMGNGASNTTISGDGATRIFEVTGKFDVSISLLTLTNGATDMSGGAIQTDGQLTVLGVTFTGNTAAGPMATMGGGAIHNTGELRVRNSTFTSNTATGASGSGGAILNTAGEFFIKGASFTANTANRAGGAIEDASGSGKSLSRNATYEQNTAGSAPGNGGAIHITGGSDLLVFDCTFTGNIASREGGALWNGSGRMGVVGTMISGNVAEGPAADDGGGGIFNNGGIVEISGQTVIDDNDATGASGSGGGIFNAVGGTIEIENSSITNNSAVRAGGGIEDASRTMMSTTGQLKINNSDLSNNTTMSAPGNGGGLHVSGAGSVAILNTTVDGNSAASEGGGLWNGSGPMAVISCEITNNTASGDDADNGGGGIFNEGGNLLIRDGSISGNTADGSAGSGGGILNNVGGRLRVRGTEITMNTSNRAGGGIEDVSGAASEFLVEDARIDSNVTNTSPGNGGGIHITGDGDLTISGGTVSGNTAGSEGGGLWNSQGTMIVSNITIDNNTASGDDATNGGGGLFNNGGTLIVGSNTIVTGNMAPGAAGSGGGIHNVIGGNLRVDGASITNNSCSRAGGGIEDASGSATMVTIRNSNISENDGGTAPGNGGGLHVGGDGSTMLRNNTFDGNTATEGGGAWNAAGTMTVRLSTFSNNDATGDDATEGGGGLFNNGGGTLVIQTGTVIDANTASGTSGSGGGIHNKATGTLIVGGATISNNTANRAGGGIEDASGAATTFTVTGCTITGNTVATNPGNGGGIHLGGDSGLTIKNGVVSGNSAGAEGGGLWNNTGIMNIIDVDILTNVALGDEADNGGGGVFNNGGTLNISDGTLIDGNMASGAAGSGGGVFTTDGAVTILSSTISNNTSSRAGGGVEQVLGQYESVAVDYTANVTGDAPGNGGAFHVTGDMGADASASFTGGSVTGNTATGTGGGLWNQAGVVMTVSEVSITGNTASGTGGGGIWNNGGDLEVERSLIATNTATGEGAGVYNGNDGMISINASTVTTNVGTGVYDATMNGSTNLTGVTVAMNTTGLNTGLPAATTKIFYTGSIISTNVVDIAPGALTQDDGENVVTDLAAGLLPLADNGGPTMTHALAPTSSAIDLFSMGTGPDQRGEAVFGAARDAGAFELQSPPVAGLASNNEATATDLDEEKDLISVYPNPVAGDRVNITIPTAYEGATTVRVIDGNGRVHNTRQVNSGGASVRFSVAELPGGMYTIQAINGKESQSIRVMVSH